MANNAKENFNQAMFSMFGVGKDPDAVKASAARETTASAETAVGTAVEKESPAAVKPTLPRTYIASGTTLEGDMHASGDVEISGTLKGNITADGSVVVRSALNGNISAAALQIINCTITGDVRVSGQLILDKGSTVVGNVFAKEFICSGEVKGDLNIDDKLSLMQSAKVEGNISTGGMEMASGAILSGKVEMKAPAKSK